MSDDGEFNPREPFQEAGKKLAAAIDEWWIRHAKEAIELAPKCPWPNGTKDAQTVNPYHLNKLKS